METDARVSSFRPGIYQRFDGGLYRAILLGTAREDLQPRSSAAAVISLGGSDSSYGDVLICADGASSYAPIFRGEVTSAIVAGDVAVGFISIHDGKSWFTELRTFCDLIGPGRGVQRFSFVRL